MSGHSDFFLNLYTLYLLANTSLAQTCVCVYMYKTLEAVKSVVAQLLVGLACKVCRIALWRLGQLSYFSCKISKLNKLLEK